jgi:hypothetical protein
MRSEFDQVVVVVKDRPSVAEMEGHVDYFTEGQVNQARATIKISFSILRI